CARIERYDYQTLYWYFDVW
nr:immunoglobulin heavy chain junction region [Mus musculus]MBK4187818.1 immunoglobulin heavy chain junction region [Mus musculus]